MVCQRRRSQEGECARCFQSDDMQDVHGLLGMERLGKLVASLRSRADLVVIRIADGVGVGGVVHRPGRCRWVA